MSSIAYLIMFVKEMQPCSLQLLPANNHLLLQHDFFLLASVSFAPCYSSKVPISILISFRSAAKLDISALCSVNTGVPTLEVVFTFTTKAMRLFLWK
jgi:hypothetical protein